MRILYLIPARGGSKGVPDKNIKEMLGTPLISYTINAAQEVASPLDCVCVSTDSVKIKSVVESRGLEIPFLRPLELATDSATTESVIFHAIDYFKDKNEVYDVVVLLQPTSPLRNSKHIKEALESFFQSDVDMVVSVKETKSNPYYILFEENEEGFLFKSKQGNFTRRQDCPKVYELNGAVYIFSIEKFLKNGFAGLVNRKKYLMDEMSSVDIDTELDWFVCEYILKKGLK